ncbi:HesA/MoeB/ThiF family protein [Chachezhania antarctica]|uniref:HesA/MoeB/ThiF family protein n=1 Tax=Chachezhania antarctica TaxID=2340860 RepID=UPI000EAC9761|nr:HesA/MoeB/ThiF family protein [Chachezhania antarctica]
MTRYDRQIALPEIGETGQAKIARAHVAVIGAGGLGCPVLQYLAGAGVGRITLFDPDHVEESNLHRQPLYTMADIGRPKAQAARDRVLAINPGVGVSAHVAPLSPANAPSIVAEADIVIDAADSYAVSYILSDTCLAAAGVPLIAASVLGRTGYAGGFCGGAPSLRAVFPDLPASGATCATSGVMGPAVGMIGALQAQLALHWILGLDPSPLGRMITVDLARFHLGGFTFHGEAEPPRAIPFVEATMLRPDDRVIDLRDAIEAPVPAAPQAIRLTPEALPDLPTSHGRTVLCCTTGLRAWRGAELLATRGFPDLALIAAKASG